MLKFLRLTSLVTLLALPFVSYVGNAAAAFELPKLLFLNISVAISFISLYLYYRFNGRTSLILNIGLVLQILHLLATSISSVFSINWYMSLWGNLPLPAESLWSTIIVFLYCLCLVQVIRHYEQMLKLVYVLIGLVFVQTFYGFLQSWGIDWTWWAFHKSVWGTIGLTIAYSTMLACLMPFVLFQFLERNNSRYVTIGLGLIQVLVFYVMLSATSRAPLFCYCLALLGISISNLLKADRKTKFKKVSFVLGAPIVGFTLFSLTNFSSEFSEKITASNFSHSSHVRLEVAQQAVRVWKSYPIWGSGPETFVITQGLQQTPEFNTYFWEMGWLKAHNHMAHHLSTTGIVGFSILALIFCVILYITASFTFKSLLDRKEQLGFYIGVSYITLFVANLTCFNVVYTQLLYWVLPSLFFNTVSLGTTVTQNFFRFKIPKVVWILICGSVIYISYIGSTYWYSDVVYQKAMKLRSKEQNLVGAFNAIESAIALNPQNPLFMVFKALTLNDLFMANYPRLKEPERIQTLKQVEAQYDQAYAISNNFEPAVHLLAKSEFALYMTGLNQNPERAIAAYEKVKQLIPKHPEPYFRQAQIYEKAGQKSKFETLCLEAIKLKADYLNAYLALASFYISEKRNEEAKVTLEKILRVRFIREDFISQIFEAKLLSKKLDKPDLTAELGRKYQLEKEKLNLRVFDRELLPAGEK